LLITPNAGAEQFQIIGDNYNKVGNKWDYDIKILRDDDVIVNYEGTATWEFVRKELYEGYDCYVLEMQTLIPDLNSDEIEIFHWSFSSTAIEEVRYEDEDEIENIRNDNPTELLPIWVDESAQNFQYGYGEFTEWGKDNPSFTVDGTSTSSITFIGLETITVPAGTIECIKFEVVTETQDGNSELDTIIFWTNVDYGIVKMHHTSWESDDGTSVFTAELSSTNMRKKQNSTLPWLPLLLLQNENNTFNIELISVSVTGESGNSHSYNSSINEDGRLVAFESSASNLVSEAAPDYIKQIYLRDRNLHSTKIISINGTNQRANNNCYQPNISGDGRYIVFQSYADNLVPNDTNESPDIFVCEVETLELQRVNVSSEGVQAEYGAIAASISYDGRYVVFDSQSTNIVDSDSNGYPDTFVHDRLTGSTELVSISPNGEQLFRTFDDFSYYASRARISGDGRFVIFTGFLSMYDQFMNIYIRDRLIGKTSLVSVGLNNEPSNGDSYFPQISNNGRYIAFETTATNIVYDDTDTTPNMTLVDLSTGEKRKIHDGYGYINGDSNFFSGQGPYIKNLQNNQSQEYDYQGLGPISLDGKYIVFGSGLHGITPIDTNYQADVFLIPNTLFN
jgi:hypothetical protein